MHHRHLWFKLKFYFLGKMKISQSSHLVHYGGKNHVMERINVHLATITPNNWHTSRGCPKCKLHSVPKKENNGKKIFKSSDHCSAAVIWFITPLWSPACFVTTLHHPCPLAKGQFLRALDKCWRMKRLVGKRSLEHHNKENSSSFIATEDFSLVSQK